MTARAGAPDARDAIARVLAAHRLSKPFARDNGPAWEVVCLCGEAFTGNIHADAFADHHSHVADALLASGVLTRLPAPGSADDALEVERWPFGSVSAAQLIASVSWPNERREDRDAWSVRMLDEPEIFALEEARARSRLAAAIAHVGAVLAGRGEGGHT